MSKQSSIIIIENFPDLSTIVDILSWRSLHQPEQIGYIFLEEGETESTKLTYRDLDLKAKRIATKLQSMGLSGERALLLYPSGLEFIAAFFGCLYAGVIAVPIYPPRRNQNLSRLQVVVADAQAKVALTNQSILSNIEQHFVETPDLAELYWLATDRELNISADEWQYPEITKNDLCFLQYTSGSTGMPKGVVVSHGNLLNNQLKIQKGFGNTEKTKGLGWLPLFHDMGLIGHVIQPLYLGIPSFLMPPAAFLQKPVRWLKAISNYQITTSGGPNFAYDLCLKKITPEQQQGLDLSSWEVAFNGAEPVQAETLEQFAAKFAPYGFRREAFYPCYGMAEATLFITGGQKSKSPVILSVEKAALNYNQVLETSSSQEGACKLVSCGHSWLGHHIVIAHPETLEKCLPNQVGEIWVSGESIAQGYWNQVKATKENFHAYLKDTGEGPFLRTGDLGFLKEGELFVTGRVKDVIIIRGRNHYPQDIELTVEQSHPALIPHHSAAFMVEIAGEEKLVVVSEIERRYRHRGRPFSSESQKNERRHSCLPCQTEDSLGFLIELEQKPIWEEVVNKIRQAVSRNHGLQVYAVCLIRFGTIPKTSSGKIQRYACRKGFLERTLNVIYNSNTPILLETKMVTI
jgi:acyl-CoA synthetase (AMP-forming)/AMP-acid ligase II